jgi:hypothetical protein
MLAVCFALALQGAAQASVVVKPCPMQKAGQVKATHATNTVHHCCNDADTAAKTGKACKTGQACLAAGAWLMSPLALCSFSPATVPLVSSHEPFALCIDPGSRWRPPALS